MSPAILCNPALLCTEPGEKDQRYCMSCLQLKSLYLLHYQRCEYEKKERIFYKTKLPGWKMNRITHFKFGATRRVNRKARFSKTVVHSRHNSLVMDIYMQRVILNGVDRGEDTQRRLCDITDAARSDRRRRGNRMENAFRCRDLSPWQPRRIASKRQVGQEGRKLPAASLRNRYSRASTRLVVPYHGKFNQI